MIKIALITSYSCDGHDKVCHLLVDKVARFFDYIISCTQFDKYIKVKVYQKLANWPLALPTFFNKLNVLIFQFSAHPVEPSLSISL